MSVNEEKKKLLEQLENEKQALATVRTELNEAEAQKEKVFEQRRTLSNEISGLIKENITVRDKRNKLTKKVKERKKERDEKNKEVKELIDKLVKSNKEKAEVLKKKKIDFNPASLQSELKRLERKIETEVLSFDKERKLMKKIKEVKKKVASAKEVGVIFDQQQKLQRKLKKAKKEAKEAHKVMQQLAKESQEQHEVMTERSKRIDELKEKETQLQEKVAEEKQKCNNVRMRFKEQLAKTDELRNKLGMKREQDRVIHKKREKAMLKGMETEVEEKIKKRQKLTTEDLLVFQRSDNKEQ